MRNKLLLIGILGLMLSVVGCGKEGPTGPTGPQGSPGVLMVKEYTGQFTSAGDFVVSVPEIQGRRSSTYVMVYWSVSGSAYWTPMADGWTNSEGYTRIAQVSWSNGEVKLLSMKANDYYLIQVFSHN